MVKYVMCKNIILKKNLVDFFSLFIKYNWVNKSLVNFVSAQENYSFVNFDKYISKKDFYYFFYKILLVNYSLFFQFFFLNYSNLTLKNHRINYYLEYYCVHDKIFVPRIYFFNRLYLSKIYYHKSTLFRIDIVTFLTLGSYTEYVRRFYYNQKIICNNLELENSRGLKRSLHIELTIDRIILMKDFIINLITEDYIIYDRQYSLPEINCFQLSNDLPFYSNLIVSKFLNCWLLLFNQRFFAYMLDHFHRFFRPYMVLENYRVWTTHLWVFKFKVFNALELYFLLRKVREEFDFYSIWHLFSYIFVLIDRYFIQHNIYYFLFYFSKEAYFFVSLDYVVVEWISNLYLRFFDRIFFIKNVGKCRYIKSIWEVLAYWYHFDYLYLPYSYDRENDLFSWFNYIKYNLEYNAWISFNMVGINKYRLYDHFFISDYSEVEFDLVIFNKLYKEVYCYFIYNYFISNDTIVFHFYFIINFASDVLSKIIALSYHPAFCCLNMKLVKYFMFNKFYHNINYFHRYVKHTQYFIETYDDYDDGILLESDELFYDYQEDWIDDFDGNFNYYINHI